MQLYLRLGLEIKKVHHVLEFDQSKWLKLYIKFNTQRKNRSRKNGGKYEKAFYKLINSGVHSKAMENVRNRVGMRQVNNAKYCLKWISKPNFITQKIFDSNLVAIHKIKTNLQFNKPAYVGMCILELSKVPMYEFLYYYIKFKYGNKSRLLFTDTDSLDTDRYWQIETSNVYNNFSKNK